LIFHQKWPLVKAGIIYNVRSRRDVVNFVHRSNSSDSLHKRPVTCEEAGNRLAGARAPKMRYAMKPLGIGYCVPLVLVFLASPGSADNIADLLGRLVLESPTPATSVQNPDSSAFVAPAASFFKTARPSQFCGAPITGAPTFAPFSLDQSKLHGSRLCPASFPVMRAMAKGKVKTSHTETLPYMGSTPKGSSHRVSAAISLRVQRDMELSRLLDQVLVLNASYEPLSVVSAPRALTLIWEGKAAMVVEVCTFSWLRRRGEHAEVRVVTWFYAVSRRAPSGNLAEETPSTSPPLSHCAATFRCSSPSISTAHFCGACSARERFPKCCTMLTSRERGTCKLTLPVRSHGSTAIACMELHKRQARNEVRWLGVAAQWRPQPASLLCAGPTQASAAQPENHHVAGQGEMPVSSFPQSPWLLVGVI